MFTLPNFDPLPVAGKAAGWGSVRCADTPNPGGGGRVGAGLSVGGTGSKLSSGAAHHLGFEALAPARGWPGCWGIH